MPHAEYSTLQPYCFCSVFLESKIKGTYTKRKWKWSVKLLNEKYALKMFKIKNRYCTKHPYIGDYILIMLKKVHASPCFCTNLLILLWHTNILEEIFSSNLGSSSMHLKIWGNYSSIKTDFTRKIPNCSTQKIPYYI